MTTIRDGHWLSQDRAMRTAVVSAFASFAMIAYLWIARHGSLDTFGRPVGTDFTAFWTAGRLATEGRATAAWNPNVLNAHITATHGVSYITAWMYTPIFLLLIVPLAELPYLVALALWQLGSLVGLALALRLVLPDGRALFIAMASPLSVMTLANGQNAFLTAALLCAGLALLEKRPIMAGILLSGLSFKPQLALVIGPLLLFSGAWRAIASAATATALLTAGSVLLWGLQSWEAFLSSAKIARFLLETGDYGLSKSASLFSMMRRWDAPLSLSYATQAMGAIVTIMLLWGLRRAPRSILSAAACCGVALTTPYLMDYDMASVGVGAAFLYAYARNRSFLPYERSAFAFIWLAPWFSRPASEYLAIPFGPVATLLLLGLIIRRAVAEAQTTQLPVTASPSRHSRAASAR